MRLVLTFKCYICFRNWTWLFYELLWLFTFDKCDISYDWWNEIWAASWTCHYKMDSKIFITLGRRSPACGWGIASILLTKSCNGWQDRPKGGRSMWVLLKGRSQWSFVFNEFCMFWEDIWNEMWNASWSWYISYKKNKWLILVGFFFF